LIAEEQSSALDSVAGWTAFSDRIERLGRELTGVLADVKRTGKRIAGFGAPAKATTLMYRFDLDRSVVDYIIDDSPLKQHLYTPGRHVPVVPWSETERAWPDYLLILAWNFAEPIVSSHRSYSAAGGRFIIPLPEVKIL
jgi:hypothetical protein